MISVYECVVVSIDGEHEYQDVSYIIADSIVEAQEYFDGELKELFGAENYDKPDFPQKAIKPGYWDNDREVFVFIERVNMVRGILINKVGGGAVFMELKPLWRDDNEIPDRESYQNAGQGPDSPDRAGG